jgi:hypothetical protein
MSFINKLVESKGETGERGLRGPRGLESTEQGPTGPTGLKGPQGPQGAAGANAGQNPSFQSVDLEFLNCANSLKNNGNKILQSTTIQLNNSWRDIPGICNRFTGIVILTSASDNLSCGTFAVSNSSTTNNSGLVTELSVQGDFLDSSKRVRLGYVGGELKATKDNEGMYQIYNVSYFGYHP